MRYLTFFTALLLSGFLTAQDNAAQPESKFGLGLAGSFDYCHRLIYADDTTGIGQVFTYFRDNEIPALGFSSGIIASYRLNEHLSIEASPRYSLNKYKTKQLIFTDQNGTQIGYGYITYSNRFISIPIGIQYHSSVNKIGLIGGASLVPEYALGIWSKGNYNLPNTFDVYDSPQKEILPELRSFMLSGMINAGVEYNAGKLSVQILPQYKIGFFKQATDVPVNRRLWSAGLEFRVLYSV